LAFAALVSESNETPEIDAHEAHRVWTDGSAQIVDVREPREWTDAHIPDCVHIPLGDLVRRHAELDPTRAVVAMCHSGVRSLSATDALLAHGFAEVASLRGGIVAWYEAGFEVEQ
jgi:rhodanese-related sulfurtransferase